MKDEGGSIFSEKVEERRAVGRRTDDTSTTREQVGGLILTRDSFLPRRHDDTTVRFLEDRFS